MTNDYTNLGRGNGGNGGNGDRPQDEYEEWQPPVQRYEPLLNLTTGEWVYAGYNRRDRTVIPIDPNTGAPIFGGYFATQDGMMFVIDGNGRIARDQQLSQSEMRTLGLGIPGGTYSTAGATRNYAAEAAAQQAHERWMLEQQLAAEEALQQEQLRAQAEEAEKTRLAQYKLARMGELTSLLGDWFQRRQDYERWLGETAGQDPIRAAIMGQGGTMRGTSPMQAYRGRLQQFLAQPTPQLQLGYDVSPQDLDIQGRLLRRGLQLPAMPAFGLARGGILEMVRGPDGTYTLSERGGSQALPAGSGVLVGEGRHGEGIAAGTAEVLRFNPDQTIEIIPLVAAAAYGGAFRAMPEDQAASIRAAFAPVYREMGFSDLPTYRRTVFGTMQPQGIGAAQGLQRMGYQPTLFQLRGTPNLYWLDPEGQLHAMSQDIFREAQFRPENVVDVGMEDLAALTGRTGRWETIPQLSQPPSYLDTAGRNPYAAYTVPITIPGLDLILPSVAQALQAYRRSNPALQQQMVNAWRLGGMELPQIEAAMQFFSPTGTGGGAAGWR